MKVFDFHCDTIFEYLSGKRDNNFISEVTLMNGNYIAQCFAIYTPPNKLGEEAQKHYNNCKTVFRKIFSNGSFLKSATTKKEILHNLNNGKVSSILTIENAEFLNNDISRIKQVCCDGVRILGLVHNGENCLGYPHSSKLNMLELSLKNFGKNVVYALNSENIYVDVSHLNIGGFKDVIDISKKPVIATHSGCRSVYDHSRNLYDWQIKAIAEKGGIIGVTYYSEFLNGTNKTAMNDIIIHLKHLINVGGEDAAALGSDFDGFNCILPINNCGEIQTLCNAVIKEFGYSLAEKICYKNAMRLF